MSNSEQHYLARWRLVLGKDAEAHQIACEGDAQCERVENLVGYLFDGEDGTAGSTQSAGGRSGGSGGGRAMSVPQWVNEVNELFPAQAKEVLQAELIRRRGIDQLLGFARAAGKGGAECRAGQDDHDAWSFTDA